MSKRGLDRLLHGQMKLDIYIVALVGQVYALAWLKKVLKYIHLDLNI